MKTPEELATDWAEENHISAIVDKPETNILFAKRLAAEAFLDGYAAAKAKRWISVEEALPAMGEKVLIHVRSGDIRTAWLESHYKTGEPTWRWADDHLPQRVTFASHWLPLPEPPKPE